MSLFNMNLRSVLAAVAMAVVVLVSGPVFAQTNNSQKVVSLSVLAGSPDASPYVQVKPEFRADYERLGMKDIVDGFPRMNRTDIEILGHGTNDYNCIGWSLGLHKWVSPITAPQANRLDVMDTMYELKGYKRQTGLNFAKEAGLEKVVVYAFVLADGSIAQVTHAARQDVDGTWTSKLGGCPLIRHQTPEVLSGPAYGEPVAVYARKVTQS